MEVMQQPAVVVLEEVSLTITLKLKSKSFLALVNMMISTQLTGREMWPEIE